MIKTLVVGCLTLIAPLSAEMKVLAFSGSTRADSYNKKLVREAADIAKQMGAKVTVIDLKDYVMPLYDGDLEAKSGMPANAKKLRKLMIGNDAIIISSPNYNGSISGTLKNVIDWMSRSEDGKPSRDAFKGKRFAIMSASPGSTGGARNLAHLDEIIGRIGGEVMPLQLSVPAAHNAFNAKGVLEDPALKQALKDEIAELLQVQPAEAATS
jgi:NAD(P)H-dependent FMN reductase